MATLLSGCKEDELKLYDGTVSVYFNAIDAKTSFYIDETTFGFGTIDAYEYIWEIPVAATGRVSSQNRTYSVNMVSAVNAVRGEHYDYPDNVVFPAGETRAYFPVTLYRGPDGDEEMRRVKFELQPNENFNVDIKTVVHASNIADTVDVTTFTLDFTSSMTAPTAWREAFFGYFSVAKYILMTELMGVTNEKWDSSLDSEEMSAWVTVLQNYLLHKLSLGHGEAVKDPHWSSKRGYMTMEGSNYNGTINDAIPNEATAAWPDYEQNANPYE